jgi:hypothetical protein
MSSVNVSKQYSQFPDPLSLDGMDDFLNGLLDRVFDPTNSALTSDKIATPSPVRALRAGEFEEVAGSVVGAGAGIFSRSRTSSTEADSRPSLFEGDDSYYRALKLEIQLLEAKLDFKNTELKNSISRIKTLEADAAVKDGQLKFLPELFRRSIDANKYEMELVELRDTLSTLSDDLTTTQTQLNAIRAHWLGKVSAWLLDRKG